MIRLMCIAIGYCFGVFQTAFIYGKLKGIDIRTVGSGNAGTTNTLRALGTKAGLIVLFGDIIKTMLAIGVTKLFICPMQDESMRYLLIFYTALGVIIGHNYPFYMGFKGGKGIASTAGLILSLNPWYLLVGLIMFFTPFVTLHYVSLGSLLVYLGLVTQTIIFGQMGLLGDMSQTQLYELYAIAIFLMAMAYWRHRENIVKLIKGTERKTYLIKQTQNK